MDYEQIYNNSKKELETLKAQKAVVDSRIDTLAAELGLDTSNDLQPQIDALKKAKDKERETLEANLSQCLKEMEDLNISTDGESFE